MKQELLFQERCQSGPVATYWYAAELHTCIQRAHFLAQIWRKALQSVPEIPPQQAMDGS